MTRKTATAERPAVSTAEASQTLSSFGAIVTALRKAPLPETDGLHEAMHGLKPKPRHVAALMQVADCDRMSVTELADRLRITLATASQVVTDLADLGLVQRVEDPEDRRRTLVVIADVHRSVVDAVLDSRLRPLQTALGRLTAQERSGLLSGLNRLASEMGLS
jgi:DNA-binding MarR family transcriptional regulator